MNDKFISVQRRMNDKLIWVRVGEAHATATSCPGLFPEKEKELYPFFSPCMRVSSLVTYAPLLPLLRALSRALLYTTPVPTSQDSWVLDLYNIKTWDICAELRNFEALARKYWLWSPSVNDWFRVHVTSILLGNNIELGVGE